MNWRYRHTRARNCLLFVFILQFHILLAQLQGPIPNININVPEEPMNTPYPIDETAAPVSTESTEQAQSNERKSAVPVQTDKEETSPTAAPSVSNPSGMSREVYVSNFMQAAAYNFERLRNKNLAKLKEQIEQIEAKQEVVPPEPETPEMTEAEAVYQKADKMLSKPNGDRRYAYSLLRKAAEMNHLKARVKMAWLNLLGHYLDVNFDLAIKDFDDLVTTGDPDAHMGLAFIYSVGVGGKNVSQPLALIHLTLAALGDNSIAQMALGYRHLFGVNVPINCEKSLSYYKSVAKKVAAKITFSNGPSVHRVRLLDESENPGSQETEIVDYYQLLADKGDVQSQVGLGQLYYQGGKAIQQDYQKALEYFTQAAKAGNAIGFAFLGKLYLEGSDDIVANNETAFMFFKKAADLGDPVGQSGLGLMYLNGLGVTKDTLKALNYFTQAADQGWVDGQLELGIMYFAGNGVKTDYKLALKYFNLAAQSGHVMAYYYLGIMATYGMGMLRSCPTAVEFFKNVAERGHLSRYLMHAYTDYKNARFDEAFMKYALLAEMGYEVGLSNAAYLLDRGDVNIFNNRHEELIRAFYYWKRAAAQGYSAAQVKLGDYYYYGWGTNVDFETAASLYRKASDQQYNAQAMFNLGYMHEQGLGMKKDLHLAKRLYDLAAETNADAKVPVAIALLKLQMIAKIESIKESPYKFIFYLDENIAANWDLYMITILTLLLGFIMYTRRPYQQQPAQQADATPLLQENNEAAANEGNAVAGTSSNENVLPTSSRDSSSSSTSSSNTPSSTALDSAARASTADPND